jgi:outer membrane protein TolC
MRLAVYSSALLAGARQEREGALAGYRSGELALIALLDFERALARAEIDRVRARIDAADALAELALRAAGDEPDDEDRARVEGGGR